MATKTSQKTVKLTREPKQYKVSLKVPGESPVCNDHTFTVIKAIEYNATMKENIEWCPSCGSIKASMGGITTLEERKPKSFATT